MAVPIAPEMLARIMRGGHFIPSTTTLGDRRKNGRFLSQKGQ